MPELYRRVPGPELLDWTAHANIELTDQPSARLLRGHPPVHLTAWGETLYEVRLGRVWVGKAKLSVDAQAS